MRLLSWNVNGIRAVMGKGFGEFVTGEQPDILCLQETKASPDQVTLPLEMAGYHSCWNPAQKPGYSGVAVFSREEPLDVKYGFGIDDHDAEGRLLTLEYPDFFLVNVYTPNSQDGLRRLPYRLQWDETFRLYLASLEQRKPVIFCGDLNVAHQEIDIARPKANRFTAGFSDEERASFGKLIESGFIDTFRYFYPEQRDAYSWWSYRAGARAKNVGWRIDYFGVSRELIGRVVSADILCHIHGSDHCPVGIRLG